MPELVAQGPQPENNWRRRLPAGPVVLGRGPEAWAAPWEPFLARRQAELEWRIGRLVVRPNADARNPVFRDGEAAAAPFELGVGGSFVVGHTTFTVAADAPSPSDPGAKPQTLTVA